jgi:hypothetical protein
VDVDGDQGCAELTGVLEDDDCICRVNGDVTICECDTGEPPPRCDGPEVGVLTIDNLLVTHDRALCQVTWTPDGGSSEQSWWMQDTSIDTASCDTTLDFSTTLPSGASVSITVDECTGESCGCAQDCPTDCSTCDSASLTVVVSGYSESDLCTCPTMGIYCDSLNRTENNFSEVSCEFVSGCITIYCVDGTWIIKLECPAQCTVEWTAPDIDGCPPTSGWSETGTDCGCSGGNISVSYS